MTVTAGDGTYSAAVTFTWTINGAGHDRRSRRTRRTSKGDTVSLSISASDSSSGTLKYSAVGLPAGLKINTSTGAITGHGGRGSDAANGPYTVTVTASDGTYSASATFNWTINSPITITDPGEQDDSVGQSVSLQIEASDSSGGTLTYLATGLPSGLSINATTGLISGTISNSSDATGIFNVFVTVTDGVYSDFGSLIWNVVAPALGEITLTQAKPAPEESKAISVTVKKEGDLQFEGKVDGAIKGKVKVWTGINVAPVDPKKGPLIGGGTNQIEISFESANGIPTQTDGSSSVHWLQLVKITTYSGAKHDKELNTLIPTMFDVQNNQAYARKSNEVVLTLPSRRLPTMSRVACFSSTPRVRL